MRSRRGSAYIVEASFIFPVIIAVTVMLLAAAVYIYGLTALCSDMNRAVRRSAGEEARTVFYSEHDGMSRKNIPVSLEKGIITGSASAYAEKNIKGYVIFNISRTNKYTAETVLVNEAEVLWNIQAVKNAVQIFKRE